MCTEGCFFSPSLGVPTTYSFPSMITQTKDRDNAFFGRNTCVYPGKAL